MVQTMRHRSRSEKQEPLRARVEARMNDRALPERKPKLLERMRFALRARHYSRNGKGAKDRITMLPESLKAPLQAQHLKPVKAVRQRDLADGWGRV